MLNATAYPSFIDSPFKKSSQSLGQLLTPAL